MPGLDLGMIAMNDSFFSHLEDSTVRELLARTPLQDAALVTVGPSLHIENYNDAARQLIRLLPLERIDQLPQPKRFAPVLQTSSPELYTRNWTA